MCQVYIGIWISDKRKNLFAQFYNCSFGNHLLADNVNPMPFGIVLFFSRQLLVQEAPAGSLHYIISHSVLRDRMKKKEHKTWTEKLCSKLRLCPWCRLLQDYHQFVQSSLYILPLEMWLFWSFHKETESIFLPPESRSGHTLINVTKAENQAVLALWVLPTLVPGHSFCQHVNKSRLLTGRWDCMECDSSCLSGVVSSTKNQFSDPLGHQLGVQQFSLILILITYSNLVKTPQLN